MPTRTRHSGWLSKQPTHWAPARRSHHQQHSHPQMPQPRRKTGSHYLGLPGTRPDRSERAGIRRPLKACRDCGWELVIEPISPS